MSRSGSSIAVDTLAGAGAKSVFVVESMIFDGVLSLAFKPNSAIAGDRQVVEYKVLRADGRPAPDWMERPALDLLQGRRSAESEQIDLSITAVLSDGSSATQTVRVHTSTGVIERIADRRTELAPKLFSEQFAAAGVLSDAQSASLAAALEWNN